MNLALWEAIESPYIVWVIVYKSITEAIYINQYDDNNHYQEIRNNVRQLKIAIMFLDF